jgi:L-2-hydroxyglutarate oxidase LhgO
MDRAQADTVVIGAGVIGLAVARALALVGREVLVLEADSAIGTGISSRSSEVIHAGLYYEPGSLKARTCLRGKHLLYDYCATKGIAHRRIGKLVVAAHLEQVDELEAILANARLCGVDDLKLLDPHRLALLEPEVRAEAALWSPSTGIVDSHALMLVLQADLEAAGGTVALNTRVEKGVMLADGCELRLAGDSQFCVLARTCINAAGLDAAPLARRIEGLPPSTVPTVHLVRGHYFGYSGRTPFRHLVYPLPEAGGLGIHATLDLAGQLRFGPDSEYLDTIDYAFDETRRVKFARAIQGWYPDLDEHRLQPGYTGIRPRLAGPGEGFRDFLISGPGDHGVPGLINLYGIESPGLTACLSLAEEIVRIYQGSDPF